MLLTEMLKLQATAPGCQPRTYEIRDDFPGHGPWHRAALLYAAQESGAQAAGTMITVSLEDEARQFVVIQSDLPEGLEIREESEDA